MAAGSGVDFLSSLPDPLVTAILSFVPFREAARTSVLSRRYRHTWRSTRSIHFDESFFVDRNDAAENQQLQRQRFLRFMRLFLTNYTANSIDEFKLTLSNPNETRGLRNDVVEMITFAASRNPRVLALDFSDPSWHDHDMQSRAPVIDLPEVMYGRRDANLESLSLHWCGFSVQRLVNSGALAGLKSLSIGWTELRLRSLQMLVTSTSPGLQSLRLNKCWNVDEVDICVGAGSRLERVVVDKCMSPGGSVQVVAPRLKKLKYSGHVASFMVDVKGCFEEADIDFGLELGFGEGGYLIYNLLVQISHVRVLTVCSYLLQELPHGEEPLKMEMALNVRHLIMKTQVHGNELCGIAFLLNSCPYLRKLQVNITRAAIFEDYYLPYKFDGFYIYRCISYSLRIVEFNGYRGTYNENYLLKYVIEHGSVMERVSITVSRAPGLDPDGLRDVAVLEFMQLQRASQTLQIYIS